MADGYNIYRGVGGVDAVDFDTAVGFSATAIASLASLGHLASTLYTYVIRPTKGGIETPDYGCVAEFETDASGEWVGAVPLAVPWLAAEVGASGAVTLRWRYVTGDTAPTTFGIWYGSSKADLTGTADESVSYTADGLLSHTFTLSGGTYYFSIKARSATADSPARIIGPVLVDTTAPSAPTILTRTRF